mmetsp:Transcript_15620/g.28643  ORF Transcript_15620/g.28643 Transcript_15620/m.28643 type:complete len:603 (+) Transcript_15620:252-2060(+)|eukprot:CAMPEP_0184540996 /NCGR_PEP_ID=MMETSP0199_2-20130426/1085_1 /TAXON_ID=1112570 /ORGANISM="Thraustochytrium sp., Strain LLF1b" /LENGTH=602 /DNA_ID=CAMNT_0026934677 /DNA_START=251 /DNA_END=2059 /DNA_ORIENTATION=-
MSAKSGPKEMGFSHLEVDAKKGLNPTYAIEVYLDKILTGISGMKVLLLDWETTGITSMVYTQTKILSKEVFLTASLQDSRSIAIDNSSVSMMHMKGVIFCRPTRSNIQAIRQELRSPQFGEYHIFFSNIVPQEIMQQLADADERELVKQVQEFYADFYAVNNEMFSLNVNNSLLQSVPRSRWSKSEESSFFRTVEGVLASLLAFKKRPVIRYERTSELCQNFAREMKHQIEKEKQLFDFRDSESALLLVLDRRDDPVTPLLTQWTYQAMVHELLGIRNNRVSLKSAPGVSADLEEVVLSVSDQFFESHMLSNFGDLGDAVQGLLQTYQKQTSSNRQIETIEDMQRFVESYPEFKKFGSAVSKHVAVVGELARLVSTHKLMDISQLEQELACTSDHAAQVEEVKAKVSNPSVAPVDAVRLVLLYAIRFESHASNQITVLKRLLRDRGLSSIDVQLVDHILAYAGAAKRGADLFGDNTLLSKSLKFATRAIKGVQNVYTQHRPLLEQTLEQLGKGKLKESAYPFLGPGNAKDKPREVIVFMLGGVTFEEAAAVQRINQANTGMTVVLGGSNVHNSKSFLAELTQLGSGATGAFPATGFYNNSSH